MSIRTPNFITTKEVTIDNGPQDKQILPAASSVRPVDDRYIPEHVKERYKWGLPADQQLCYTHYGFVPIRKDWIREV